MSEFGLFPEYDSASGRRKLFDRKPKKQIPQWAEKSLAWILVALMMVVAPCICLFLLHQKHGPSLSTKSFAEMAWSEEHTQRVMEQHSQLFIGGPHRGGTTILWKLLSTHPAISGFSKGKLESTLAAYLPGGDFATHTEAGMELEGLYLQDVYPTLGLKAQAGISGQLPAGMSLNRRDSFGRFALLPEAHFTEYSSFATPENRNKLFRQWAKYWNLSRPVLMEKSPPNMIWMRFLQAMFLRSKFVVVTRHPLANALAHRRWSCCSNMALEDLVEHWVKQHEIMREDSKSVNHLMVIPYEDFVQNSQRYLDEICVFLGIDHFEFTTSQVSTNTNSKYVEQYERILNTEEGLKQHHALVEKFEKNISELILGYSLTNFTFK